MQIHIDCKHLYTPGKNEQFLLPKFSFGIDDDDGDDDGDDLKLVMYCFVGRGGGYNRGRRRAHLYFRAQMHFNYSLASRVLYINTVYIPPLDELDFPGLIQYCTVLQWQKYKRNKSQDGTQYQFIHKDGHTLYIIQTLHHQRRPQTHLSILYRPQNHPGNQIAGKNCTLKFT